MLQEALRLKGQNKQNAYNVPELNIFCEKLAAELREPLVQLRPPRPKTPPRERCRENQSLGVREDLEWDHYVYQGIYLCHCGSWAGEEFNHTCLTPRYVDLSGIEVQSLPIPSPPEADIILEEPSGRDVFEDLIQFGDLDAEDLVKVDHKELLTNLGVEPAWKEHGEKERVYFKGVKQLQICNKLPVEGQSKLPLFKEAKLETKPRLTIGEKINRGAKDLVPETITPYFWKKHYDAQLVTDEDLVYHLKMEFAFQRRTPTMLQAMRLKAIRWLRKFDLSNYSMKEQYEMMVNACTQAYMLSDAELQSVYTLQLAKTLHNIKQLNSFMMAGVKKQSLSGLPSCQEYALPV